MTSFIFKQQAELVYKQCDEIVQSLESQKENPKIKPLIEEYKTFLKQHREKSKLTISFIGQYNAGKSSTIAALTNAEFLYKQYEEIEGEKKLVEVYQVGGEKLYVGAQIMTDQTREYLWNDVIIFDTPGIYAGRVDHDQKTLNQIFKSDLLVFVVSNELFNPQSGAFFKKLIHEMQRSSQIVLVINKMSRESGAPSTLKKSILEVIEPYHPNDFYTTFIDSKDYLNALQEDDLEEREYLIEDSNFSSFLDALKNIIEKKQLTAKLSTPLHRGREVLEKALNILSTNDKLSRDMLEILRRKAILFKSAQIRFQNSARSELNKLEHQIIMAGEKVAGKIDGQHSSEEVNAALKETENFIEDHSKQGLEKIQNHLKNEIERLQSELELLENSSLAQSVAETIQARIAERKSLGEKNISEKSKMPPLLDKAPEFLNKVGQFATKITKDQVYDFVKFFGGKFKPWGATKLTKFINKLGPALSIVGTALDIFFSAKEEFDEAMHEQQLRESRAEIRDEFRNIACEIRAEYEKIIDEDILSLFKNELLNIEQQQREIREIDTLKESALKDIDILFNRVNIQLKEVLEG